MILTKYITTTTKSWAGAQKWGVSLDTASKSTILTGSVCSTFSVIPVTAPVIRPVGASRFLLMEFREHQQATLVFSLHHPLPSHSWEIHLKSFLKTLTNKIPLIVQYIYMCFGIYTFLKVWNKSWSLHFWKQCWDDQESRKPEMACPGNGAVSSSESCKVLH